MNNYYRRPQRATSYKVARAVLVTVLVTLVLACLQSVAHLDNEQDLAQLTPAQRAEVVARWSGK